MKYIVKKEHGKPMYLQLYTQLRNDIVKGIIPQGAKMPSKRLLAEELQISVITVEHSYAMKGILPQRREAVIMYAVTALRFSRWFREFQSRAEK